MNMRKTVVINVVGLTASLLGPATPCLRTFAEQGKLATIEPVLPAVTCSAQATFLTGCYPNEHTASSAMGGIFGTSARSSSGDKPMR